MPVPRLCRTLLRRLRARSWLTATRIRSSRSSGSGTGPRAASEACVSRSDSPLARAHSAHVKMRVDLLHLASRSTGHQDILKTLPGLIATVHRASSPTGDLKSGMRRRPLASALRLCQQWPSNRARPRTSLDFTVPRFTPCISATSSYTNPSISRRIKRGAEWLRHLLQRRFHPRPVLRHASPSQTATRPDRPASPSACTGVPESLSVISCSIGISCCLCRIHQRRWFDASRSAIR